MDPSLPLPRDADTASALLGDIVCDRVIIGERTYLLNRPAVRSQVPENVDAPCWVELWPAARMLARAIQSETWTPGTPALEIGCGLGLPGIVALAMGLRVTFSDYDPLALRFAADNARLNGFGNFQTLPIDWRCPPADLRVPVILASDPVFEVQHVEPVVNFIERVLAPEGVCWLTAQERAASGTLAQAPLGSGLAVEARTVREMGAEGRRVKGMLYRITRATPAGRAPNV